MKTLRGTFTVMVTPFTPNEEVDEAGFRKNIDWYIAEGIHGLICTASTGEFANLSEGEQKRLISIAVEQVNGRVPVIAGTAANSTRKTTEMTQHAQEAGADAAIIVAPFYGLPCQEEIYQHFRTISDAVEIPIMIYNNPWYAGVDMLPDLVERLSAIDSIRYIKESTSDVKRVHDIMQRCGDNIDVWCGWDDLAYECFMLGCGGWVSVAANFIPKMSAELFNLVEEKEYEKAKALYFKMLPVLNYLESGQLLGKVKEAMNTIGKAGGKPRRPFLPLTDTQKPELQTKLRALGIS
jgi:4-hydroxy-tetrahydrodipicolinate synthase